MIKKNITICNRLGLHARAAAKLVALTQKYRSKIEIVKENNCVNAKSILGVMMLAATCGTTLSFQINGEDEQLALEEIETVVKNKFGEEA